MGKQEKEKTPPCYLLIFRNLCTLGGIGGIKK